MDDAEAVGECRAGHVEAFQHLVRRYQARALAHGRTLTGNDADAADAAQEAFVDAFRNLHHFDSRREFYPWFYVLLRHRCIKQRTRPGTRPESGPLPERQAAQSASAEQAIDCVPHSRGWIRPIGSSSSSSIWTAGPMKNWRLAADPQGTVMSRLFNARRRLLVLLGGERA